MLAGISVFASTAGAGLSEFLGDGDRRTAFALALSTTVLGIYSAKVGHMGQGRGKWAGHIGQGT